EGATSASLATSSMVARATTRLRRRSPEAGRRFLTWSDTAALLSKRFDPIFHFFGGPPHSFPGPFPPHRLRKPAASSGEGSPYPAPSPGSPDDGTGPGWSARGLLRLRGLGRGHRLLG